MKISIKFIKFNYNNLLIINILLGSYSTIIKPIENEIIQDYKDSIRFAIVDHILLDPAERIRLMIDTIPIEYPVIQIRAPIPWHQAITFAGHKIEHNLFIGNEILRNIRDLYILKYNNMRIVHVTDFGKLPISALNIESIVGNLCQESSKKLEEEWLADVAEFFHNKKYAWNFLLDNKFDCSTVLIEKYFQCVNALLSKQLRFIIIETIKDVRNFFIQYNSGNLFVGPYEDLTFNKTPFMKIFIEPELGTSQLHLKPTIDEIYNAVSRCFDNILDTGSKVPRIEVIIFPDFKNSGYLFSVSRNEKIVS